MNIRDELVAAPRVPLRYLVRMNPRPRGLDASESCYLPMEAISEFGPADSSRSRPTSELAQGYSYIADGDVAYAKVTPCFENGKGLRAEDLPGGYAFATTEITVMRPGKDLDARYLAWLLQSADFRAPGEARMSGAGGLKRVPESYAASYRIPHPRPAVQQAIADYLDRETAQVDAFIAKNEELIALLTERRAAVIGHAVTRGTETTVPLKASNVEWLGDVPVHWTIAALARFATTVSGSGFPENEQGVEGADIAFYKVNALGQADADGVIRNSWDTISHETAKALRAKVLPAGTILLAKIGAALLLGRIRRTDRVACIDNNMMAIVPDQGLSPRFASYALQTFDFEALANPGTIPSMDMYALMHRETAIPPLPEQIAIADYLDLRLAEIDAALDTSRRGIQLAGERRAALISAAVAGKIDLDAVVGATLS